MALRCESERSRSASTGASQRATGTAPTLGVRNTYRPEHDSGERDTNRSEHESFLARLCRPYGDCMKARGRSKKAPPRGTSATWALAGLKPILVDLMLRCPRSSREEIEHVHGSILVCTRCDSESSRFPWRLHQWRDPGGHSGQRAGTAPSLKSKPASTGLRQRRAASSASRRIIPGRQDPRERKLSLRSGP